MPKCKAKAKSTGNPCQRDAIAGATVCQVHGGSAPQVREAARRRLLEMVDPALGVLARAVRKRKDPKWEPTPVELAAAREILNRAEIGKSETSEVESPAAASGGFSGTLEELLITLRRVTVEVKPAPGSGD